MTNSHDDTSKCFSGILRRFLCTGSLPTYPSDHIIESDTTKFHFPGKDESKTEAKTAHLPPSAPAPGIVARLMGLDTLPDTNWVPRTTLESILRSRSVNFVDYLPEFDLTQAQHRRVRTSVSFREVPTFLHQQNQDCYVLCFEKALAKTNEEKSKKLSEELKLNKSDGSRNKENMNERVLVKKKKTNEGKEKNKRACKGKDKLKSSTEPSSKVGNIMAHTPEKDVCRKPPKTLKARDQEKPINQKQVSVGSSVTKKKKKQQQTAKKVVPECYSENSSPASAFDYRINLEGPISEESRQMGLNRRGKSSSKICNCDYPSRNISSTLNGDADQKAEKPEETEEIEEYYTKLWCEICRLTEEDMKECNWVAQQELKFVNFEDICMEFGQQILEVLVNQVVDELEGLQMVKDLDF